MTSIDIANLEHASRSAMAWTPDVYDVRSRFSTLVAAIVSAVGILAVCAALLLAVL